MSRARIALALALAAPALALGACDDERRAISRDDLPEVPAEPSEVVDIGDDGFGTDEVTVTTDELVEFRNVGDEEHGVRTDDSRIDTGLLRPGESTQIVFDQPDRYQLHDVADDTATMVVVAEPADEE